MNDTALKHYPDSYTQLDHVTQQKSIIANEQPNPNHFIVNNQSAHIKPLEAEHSLSIPAQIKQDHITEDNMADNYHACDDCGLFKTRYNRLTLLLGLIWVLTVCKDYQQLRVKAICLLCVKLISSCR